MTEFSDPFMIKHKNKVDVALSEIAFRYLDRFPVYKFKNNTKQIIISAALESLEIHKDKIIVNVSYLELTKVLIGYLVMFVLAVGLVIVVAVTGVVLPFMDG